MIRLTLKELLGKKLRLVTTALAVMLGVAFMAGTLVLTDTIGRTFDGLFAEAYAGTDAHVRGASSLAGDSTEHPPVDASIVDLVAGVDGVAVAEGTISGYAELVDHEGKAVGNPGAGPPTFGESWISNPDLNPYELSTGRPPTAAGEIVIDKHSADTADFTVGETVQVLTKIGSAPFTITGIARFGDADSMGGASTVLFTAPDAQQFVGSPGSFDAISVIAAADASASEVTARIADVLPRGVEALTGEQLTDELQQATQEELSFFNTFLIVFAAIALFVGAFIIFNTFSIIITQRQKEMALLRAIGASSRQVVRSVLIEASVVGGIASAAGLALGVGVAAGLKAMLSSFGVELPSGSLVIATSTVVISLVVGSAVTVLSAFLPARRAGRIAPVAAMREVAFDRTGTSRKRLVAGSVVTVAGVASLLAGLSGEAIELVGLGVLVTFVGIAVLAPVLARPASRALGWPMRRATRLTGALAQQNAMRNPKRTASTAAALMIGVALVGFIATFAASTKQSIYGAIDDDFNGTLVVDSGAFEQGGLSHDLADEIAARPEFEAVSASRHVTGAIDGEEMLLQSWDAETVTPLFDIDPQHGDVAALGHDGIAVSETFATAHQLTIGSSLPATFAQGQTRLTVKAIYGSELWTGPAFVDHAVLDDLGADPLDAIIYVKVRDGIDIEAARSTLDDLTSEYPTADVFDKAGFKTSKSARIDTLINLIYALLGLAIIIALMGITNTLALSIFERTRELGVLRALGMTRAQLRSSVRWEAMIIAVFGTLLGLGLGVFFGWSIVSALASEGITQLVVPVPTLMVVTVIAAAAGVLAAVLPGRRAARLNVLDAIASQ